MSAMRWASAAAAGRIAGAGLLSIPIPPSPTSAEREPWAQLPNVGQARALAASGGWQILYSDFAAVLLVRRGLELPATLAATPDSPYRRLALGVQAMERGQAGEARRFLEGALAMDPRLLPACRNLAIVLAHTGKVT